jgi:hypothetical protein
MDHLYAKLCPKLKEPKFATMSDIEALLEIQSEMAWIRVLVPTSDIVAHATIHGYRASMELAKSDPSNQCRSVAINILSYIDSLKIQNVDMDLPKTQEMLGAMVACGFATTAVINSLDGLANKQVTWCESQGLPQIDLGHIVSAREINSNGIA